MSEYQGHNHSVMLHYECNNCEKVTHLQAIFSKDSPLLNGCIAFPPDGQFTCPHCDVRHNLNGVKDDLESMHWEKLRKSASEG